MILALADNDPLWAIDLMIMLVCFYLIVDLSTRKTDDDE